MTNSEVASNVAFPPLPERRYRGWLFMITLGPLERITDVALTDDWMTAMLLATAAPSGEVDIWFAAPSEGAPLRKYLAGGPNPLAIPLTTCGSLAPLVMRDAGVSKPTALHGIRKVIARRGGFGAEALKYLGTKFKPRWAGVKS